jgi:plastocyanin
MIKLILNLLFFVGLTPLAYAKTLIFHTEDQNGKSLKNVVILAGKEGELIKSSHRSIAIMDQIHKAFVPHVLTIVQGTPVDFPNSDQILHHIYSFSKPKVFQTKLYSGKPDTPILFNKPGIEVLGCNIHDSMIGYIVISDTDYWGQSNKQGAIKINMPIIPSNIRIWHPRQTTNINHMQTIALPKPSITGDYIIKLNIKTPKPPAEQFLNSRFRHNE